MNDVPQCTPWCTHNVLHGAPTILYSVVHLMSDEWCAHNVLHDALTVTMVHPQINPWCTSSLWYYIMHLECKLFTLWKPTASWCTKQCHNVSPVKLYLYRYPDSFNKITIPLSITCQITTVTKTTICTFAYGSVTLHITTNLKPLYTGNRTP